MPDATSRLGRFARRAVPLALAFLLFGCALPMSFAEGPLCEEALKHCNPTAADYDACVNRAGCGVQ